MKCLLVDDSRIVRKVCSDIMTNLGFEIAEAEDGQVALDYCMQNPLPTFILLDWNMPVMDGMEFLKAFRTGVAGNEQTKVVVCTTENDFSKIQTAIQTGADEYIMKPFDEAIIKGKLEQIGVL